MKSKEQVGAIIAALKTLYPDALCSLDYEKDYELLFSVRLAAQCTDARVNLVTPALFARYPTLEAFAAADADEVGTYIQSCGFWRAKARDIVGSAKMLVERFGGKVPDNMEDLLSLPGVGRKTANLILGDIYGKDGYVCDTHCIRITGRLGLTDGSKDPLKVEQQLRKVIPRRRPTTSATGWCSMAARCVWHGSRTAVTAPSDRSAITAAGNKAENHALRHGSQLCTPSEHHDQRSDGDKDAAYQRFDGELLPQKHKRQHQRNDHTQLVDGHDSGGFAHLQRLVIAQPRGACSQSRQNKEQPAFFG